MKGMNNTPRTRKRKIESGLEPTPHEVEVEKTTSKLSEFIPTAKQKELIDKIDNNTIIFLDSVAGTGKTSTVLYKFCKDYLVNRNLDIRIVRTPVEIGLDKIGFLPDNLDSKLAPHFASTQKILEDFLGKGKVKADLGKRIHFMPVNYALGATYDNCLILIDEVQQFSNMMLKLMLERIGKNTTVVVAGSSDQLLGSGGNRNALADAYHRFFKEDGQPKYPNIARHSFSVEDCMRSDIVKDVIRAYGGN
jgi:phosphate starvation-inducible PhoH-like protein